MLNLVSGRIVNLAGEKKGEKSSAVEVHYLGHKDKPDTWQCCVENVEQDVVLLPVGYCIVEIAAIQDANARIAKLEA